MISGTYNTMINLILIQNADIFGTNSAVQATVSLK